MGADGVGPGSVDVDVVGLAEGESVRAFGGSGEPPILEIQAVAAREVAPNRVEVFGLGACYGEARDEEAHATGRDHPMIVVDRKLVSDADCATEARQRLRWAQVETEGGWVEVWPDFALEAGDVVTVTEPRVGWNGHQCRVVGMRTTLDARRGVYTQRLWLGRR